MDGFWQPADSAESAARLGVPPGSGSATSEVHVGDERGAGTEAVAETHTDGALASEAVPTLLSAGAGQLTQSDVGNLTGLLDHEIAPNTMRSYRSQWRNFLSWAMTRGVAALPADPAHVAAYLAERIEDLGHRPATLRAAAAAIAFVHRSAGRENPCAHPEVKRTLRGATRKAGRAQKQAKGLTADALAAIRSTACDPRPGRGGRFESAANCAERRGSRGHRCSSALMRDGMLRVSEAAAVTSSGTSSVRTRRNGAPPDSALQDGPRGLTVQLRSCPTPTMAALVVDTDPEPSPARACLGSAPNHISKTHQEERPRQQGLGDGFSGHSPQGGDGAVTSRGLESRLPSLMTAGRWRTPVMPAHYTRNETARQGCRSAILPRLARRPA